MAMSDGNLFHVDAKDGNLFHVDAKDWKCPFAKCTVGLKNGSVSDGWRKPT